MSVFLLLLLLGVIYLLTCIIYFFIKTNLYWSKRNVVYVNTWTSMIKPLLGRKSFAESVQMLYNSYSDKRYVCSFTFLTPAIMIRDLELIKKITIKDFEHFTDHLDFLINKDCSNLFSLKGEQWRNMRSTISPVFTTSKMKTMFILMSETAEKFTRQLLKTPSSLLELEVQNLYTKYSNDIIASCAFGIDCNSIENDQNDFYRMGKTMTTFTFWEGINVMLIMLFPKLAKLLKLEVFFNKSTEFFKRAIKETIAYREKGGIVRPDLVNILLEARIGKKKEETKDDMQEPGYATVQENEESIKGRKIEVTDDVIASQALLFFFAGFDAVSTVLSFISYELAVNQDIQEKLFQEILEVKKSIKEKSTYETVLKLKYLDQVLSETLRKYPVGIALNRLCVKDYVVPADNDTETTLIIEKGCALSVPIYAIHRDPQYYPDPEKFDPDRFNDENKSKIVPGSYFPFGCGPRNCIASRFALLEMKVLIFHLLGEFKIQPIEKTEIPIKLSKGVGLGSVGGFWLGLEKRNIDTS